MQSIFASNLNPAAMAGPIATGQSLARTSAPPRRRWSPPHAVVLLPPDQRFNSRSSAGGAVAKAVTPGRPGSKEVIISCRQSIRSVR